MIKKLKLLFKGSTKLSKEDLFIDVPFLHGKFSFKQISNLSQLFEEIPEYLICNNEEHLVKAWQICQYYVEITQLKHEHPCYSQFQLYYPKSSIKCAMNFLLNDIKVNDTSNYHLFRLDTPINQFYSSLMTITLVFDSQFVDIEEKIISFGSKSDKPLDRSHKHFKEILDNKLKI